ncbi:MAG TPA: hypothetical protein VKV30_13825 [Candidatus Angelobacter sp.]|nr:hypothetical protein [Candidatus Angelobacter sp.]
MESIKVQRRRSPGPISHFLIFTAMGMLVLGLAGHLWAEIQPPRSTPSPSTGGANAPPADKEVLERLAAVERDTESNKRRLDETFNIFIGLGGIATFGLLFFGLLSLYRDNRQEQNYRKEREFYEERQRQERRDYRFERALHEKREGRQGRLEAARGAQDLQLGAKAVESFDRMVAAQITNVSGLGQVIDLVRQASQIRLDREKHQEELEQLIGNIKNDAEQRYQRAVEDSLRFADVTALKWPSLPEERRRVASGACRIFEQIQDFVLAEKKKKSPLEHARLLHFMGIFAYYADHNVDAALHYLTDANVAFGEDVPKEFRINQAYTKHFLGVLEKNWPLRNEPPGTSLKEAQKYLQAAESFLTMESGQFLTALTHAEVLSYRPDNQDAARKKLDEIITRIEELKADSKSNSSQEALLPRAYLLRGNLSFVSEKIDQASDDFERATKLSLGNPYACFSLAQARGADLGSAKLWQEGLASLSRPPALEKPETITRVLIFAWGIIAAHHAGKTELMRDYRAAFEGIGSGIEREGKYAPRFFSPLTKELLDFDALRVQVYNYLNKNT